MLSPSDQYSWARAKSYFETQTLKKDVVHKLHRYSSPYSHAQYPSPALTHSFVHLNGKLYELVPGKKIRNGKVAGKGGFARVKYLFDENGKRYTVKIDLYKGAADDKITTPPLETVISQDVGLFLNVGYRTKPSTHKRILEKYFRYAVMEDLGSDLSSYLIYHPNLDDKTRFNLTFQACFLVYQLHEGLSTVSGKPVVHRDIKLLNFLYDDKTGKLSLGDYGMSQYGPIDAPPPYMDGTDAYLPYVDVRRDIDAQKKQFKMHEMDIFALKRSVYYPTIRKTTNNGLQTSALTKPYALLEDKQLDAYGLRPYFETRAGDGDYHSPLLLSTVSLLALYELQAYMGTVASDESLQKALIVLHFANMASDMNVQTLLSKPHLKNSIAALLPVANLISPSHLAYTLNDSKMYQTLAHIAKLPYLKKTTFATKFNEIVLPPKEAPSPTPEPSIPKPVITLKKALLELIDVTLKVANVSKPDGLDTLMAQENIDDMTLSYEEWIKKLAEKDYAYFLILLNRVLKHAKSDEDLLNTLSEEAEECLIACQKLTEDKLLAPLVSKATISETVKEKKVDNALIEARECLFEYIKKTLDTVKYLTSYDSFSKMMAQLSTALKTGQSLDDILITLTSQLDTSKPNNTALLIYFNMALHDDNVTQDMDKLSPAAHDYFEQIREAIDQLDHGHYARQRACP